MFKRVLIANRGEVVSRIAMTLGRLGIEAVTVYAPDDADGGHVRVGAYSAAIDSYLDPQAVVAAAVRLGADAIHPGYGFLAERAELARVCESAGVVWIGPSAAAIELMGDKTAAKDAARQAGLPIVPGLHRAALTDGELAAFAHETGFPLLLKPTAGGGGKGMHVVRRAEELDRALAAARREALAAFGNDGLLAERYLQPARHIEVQVLADAHGSVVALGERECSLQRRHQKVVEETPAPALESSLQATLSAHAVALARACGYLGAGTVEFIVEAEAPGRHYFLEMNTRLQVEHAVTEQVLGIDLVEWQLRVAAGEPLALGDRTTRGHAVEARIYAEDPAHGFLPAAGRVRALRLPSGPGIRVETGLAAGELISSRYDPMIAKVIAHGETRDQAFERLRAALAETVVLGVRTNVGFLGELLNDPAVVAGRLDTGLLERLCLTRSPSDAPSAALAAGIARAQLGSASGAGEVFVTLGGWRLLGAGAGTHVRVLVDGEREIELELEAAGTELRSARVDGRAVALRVLTEGQPGAVQDLRIVCDGVGERWTATPDGADGWWVGRRGGAWHVQPTVATRREERGGVEDLRAPMPGAIIAVHVGEGERVARGDLVLVMESMKMELQITAPADATVVSLRVGAGDQVALGTVLASLEPPTVTGEG